MTEIGLVRDFGHIDFVEVKNYPDGSPRVDCPVGTRYHTMLLRPRSMNDLITGLFLADAFAFRGLKIKNLFLPFVPAARQDRINDSGDYLFTLKSVANMLNARGFETVTMIDPHSMVAPALIDNSRVLSIVDVMKAGADEFYGKYAGVIAPDAGAAKRAFEVAQYLGVNFYQGEKHRDIETGKLSGFKVDLPYSETHYPIAPRRFLVVDDICDGGGTFNGLAEAVRASKSDNDDITLDLWVTHGIFSVGTYTLLKNFGQVLTTNTTTWNKFQATEFAVIERFLR